LIPVSEKKKKKRCATARTPGVATGQRRTLCGQPAPLWAYGVLADLERRTIVQPGLSAGSILPVGPAQAPPSLPFHLAGVEQRPVFGRGRWYRRNAAPPFQSTAKPRFWQRCQVDVSPPARRGPRCDRRCPTTMGGPPVLEHGRSGCSCCPGCGGFAGNRVNAPTTHPLYCLAEGPWTRCLASGPGVGGGVPAVADPSPTTLAFWPPAGFRAVGWP